MTNKLEVDALTGESVVTELSQSEIEQLEAEYKSSQEKLLAEQKTKDAARASALAKLAALGLTQDEIDAL